MQISDRKREKLRKLQLAEQLKSLPEPEYSYEVTIPQVEEDVEGELITKDESHICSVSALSELW
jgi:hypothetical protein